jgi:alpha-L-rhamnosidase
MPVGRPRFIAQLHLDYEDGSSRVVATDADWKMAQGSVRRNSIFLGEVVDARTHPPGWDRPSFDDSGWTPAAVARPPGGRLLAQSLPPIKVTETIRPAGVTEPRDGVFIVDMGTNFTGWIRLRVNVPGGTKIKLRFGELLYPDGGLNPMTSVCGQIKGMRKDEDGRRVPRGGPGAPEIAWQEDTYIASGGGPEVYTPSFTFHAFRYVEVTGVPGTVTPEMIEGLRLQSALEPVGEFACSNPLLNRIQQMCRRTFRSNIMSVQSDCPHRERFGYGGDLVTTAEAFMMNFDMARFYAKAVWDWHDSARPDGMLTDTAPFVGIQYCGVGWAMAHPLTQVELYRYYGDKRIIEQQYATSKRWFDRVASQHEDHIIKRGLSDHESLVETPAPQLVTPLYCESARLLGRMACILGRDAEHQRYAALAQAIRSAYRDRFLDPNTGTFSPGTQAAQAFALYLDMTEPADQATSLAYLIDDIKIKHQGHLSTGIFGTKYVLDVLSRENQSQVAYDIVNRTDVPGWGHMLARDATTLWEHWKYSDNTYSHNHPMFGSVSEWFYQWLGGIQPAADAVGFDRIEIRPQFIEDLGWVRCSYRSVRGPIRCHWRREGAGVTLSLDIPVNTRATVTLPAQPADITENGQPAAPSPGVTLLKTEAGSSVYRVGAGTYQFRIQL